LRDSEPDRACASRPRGLDRVVLRARPRARERALPGECLAISLRDRAVAGKRARLPRLAHGSVSPVCARGRPDLVDSPLESGVKSVGFDLYYEEEGAAGPILPMPPAGSPAAAWGSARTELARIGRVITYDRRGYARSGGEPVRSISIHTADAASLLEFLDAEPALVVGTSAGAAIAVDLAV